MGVYDQTQINYGGYNQFPLQVCLGNMTVSLITSENIDINCLQLELLICISIEGIGDYLAGN
jgi:hypothetical protein